MSESRTQKEAVETGGYEDYNSEDQNSNMNGKMIWSFTLYRVTHKLTKSYVFVWYYTLQ